MSPLVSKYTRLGASVLIAGSAQKICRGGMTDTSRDVWTMVVTLLLFGVDYGGDLWGGEGVLLGAFVVGGVAGKAREGLLKMHFWLVYVMPFNLAMGSVVHIAMWPLSLPRTKGGDRGMKGKSGI